jgi:4-carboxymuconolactone decarboxylase
MSPTAVAKSNHDKFFPNHVSTLALTDPELVEVFNNFAFDEILDFGSLDERVRFMTLLAALIAAQSVSEYSLMLGAALDASVTPIEVKEILYQAVPYVGMARAYDFFKATNDVLISRDVALPLPGQSTTTPHTRYERGRSVQERIVGSEIVQQLYQNAPNDEQRIQRLLSANCFGDHLTRAGIDLPTRELLTFTMLVTLGGCDPQVRSHVAANVHVGNNRQRLIDVLTQLLPFIGYPRMLNGLRAVDDVTGSGKN